MNVVLSPSENETTPEAPSSTADWRFKPLGLSRQESRVIELAMEGRIDKQIAQEIGISLGTVRVYWKRLRFKTGGTRSEAIAKLAKQSLQHEYDLLQQHADGLQSRLDLHRATEGRLKALEAAFASVSFPVAVIDGLSAEVLLVNDRFAALTGQKAESLLGNVAFADVSEAKATLAKCSMTPEKCSLALRTSDGETSKLEFNLCGDPGICGVLWQDA